MWHREGRRAAKLEKLRAELVKRLDQLDFRVESITPAPAEMARHVNAPSGSTDAVTAREVMGRLRREGWTEREGKGSHVIFSKLGQRSISVPRHPGDLKPGVLRSIARGAGWESPPQR
jgi:predicted RNA binding protein YcfA (HicA-like mRNA interferase family)